jgi:hypothetical protein
MFRLWFALLGGSFVLVDMGPSILSLVFPLFWVFWFLVDWQGFIMYIIYLKNITTLSGVQKKNKPGLVWSCTHDLDQ